MPRLPNDMLVLISEVNNTEAEAQIAEDTVGLPLGSQEGDFDIVTFDSSLEPSDDALVLSAEGKIVYFGLLG